MNLATQLAAIRGISDLTETERALRSCHLAKELEKAGEYEAACEALAEFWPDRAASPTVEGLDRQATADVFLRVGTLIGWLGGANQSQRQESAKDLITRSIELFTELSESERIAEAQSDLALCYWREGALDEARVTLTEARRKITDNNNDLKAVVLIRSGVIEEKDGRLIEALRWYDESQPLVARSTDNSLKGSFHLGRGTIFTSLGTADQIEECHDSALIEFAAASIHFEQAGHMRQCARVENNLGFLYQSIGRFPEAHEHINRASNIFMSLGDEAHVAQVNDTRARALLAEGSHREAERYARAAVKTLDRGDECSLLVEALTTHAVTLARLGNYSTARSELNRAIEVADNCGDLEGAGRARLTIIEELSAQTSASEMASIYKSALGILKESQDPSATRRLFASATIVIDTFEGAEGQSASLKAEGSEGLSFKQEVHAFERALLERALRQGGGSVSKASRVLGFRHHQSLISLINTRHQELLKT